jgi:hypothetical protein
MKTLNNAMHTENPQDDRELWLVLGNWLDAFYSIARTQQERQAALDEPLDEDTTLSARNQALLAASAEKLAIDYGLEIPDWTLKECYTLKEPWFAMDAKGDLRIVLLAESPNPFRIRNIFTTDNVLRRV